MKYAGLFKKKLRAIFITTYNEWKAEISGGNLDDVLIQINGALLKKDWKTVVLEKKEEEKKDAPAIYTGFKQLKEQEKAKIDEKDTVVKSSFTGFDSLFQNASELKEITQFLRSSMKTYDEGL